METAEVRSEEGGKPGFQAVGNRERGSLNGSMVASVVSEHESRNINFPVEGGLIDESCQIFGDGLVANFCLTVALGVVAGSGCVPDV